MVRERPETGMESIKTHKNYVADLGEFAPLNLTQSETVALTKRSGSICESCGKPFAQQLKRNPDTGKKYFTSFKNCPNCRETITNLGKVIHGEVKYDPFPWQQKLHESKARFKIIHAASRAGKDRASIMELIANLNILLNEPRAVDIVPKVLIWVIAPNYKMAKQQLRELKQYLPRNLVRNYIKADNTIELVNDGIIEIKSADDPESLVGVGLDFVWITEAARIPHLEAVWINIERRLASPGRGIGGKGGRAVINSSPRGRGYFYKMCTWGQLDPKTEKPKRSEWRTFHASAWDNPYEAAKRYVIGENGKTYEEDMKLAYSRKFYEEDVLGLFSDITNAVFPNFRETCVIEPPNDLKELIEFKKNLRTPKPYKKYTIGYDPAKQVDGAWAIVIDDETSEIVEMELMEKMSYPDQILKIITPLSKKWNNACINYGKGGPGEALEPWFIQSGCPYKYFDEQGRNKERLVENLATHARIGNLKIYNIDDTSEIAIRQFEDYISNDDGTKKTVTYSNATSSGHDDAVSACYFVYADKIVLDMTEIYNIYTPGTMVFPNNKHLKEDASIFNRSN